MGLVRDLRGIAFAFNAKTSFMMLFDWMYPDRFTDLFFTVAIISQPPDLFLSPGLQISHLHAHSATSHRAVVPRPSLHHARPQTHG